MRNENLSLTSMPACGTLPQAAIDILLMSGNPFLIDYFSSVFHSAGWKIAGTRDWQEGISYLNTRRAAVAVCEEAFPDGSWREAAAALSRLPDAPALVVIGRDPSLVHEVVALGGFDVLVRPLRGPDVLWTIASAWHAWLTRIEGGERGGIRCSDA